MAKTTIIVALPVLAIELPQDLGLQQALVNQRTVYYDDGSLVEKMLPQGLLPSHTCRCLPYLPLINLLLAMADCLQQQGACDIHFVLMEEYKEYNAFAILRTSLETVSGWNEQIFLALVRHEKSNLVSILASIGPVTEANRVVVLSNQDVRLLESNAHIDCIVVKDLVERIVSHTLWHSSTIEHLVKTWLQAVSPFQALAAFMRCLRGKTEYHGAHFFVTHDLWGRVFGKTTDYGSPTLLQAFQFIQGTLKKVSPSWMQQEETKQAYLEWILSFFTEHLVKVIPLPVIREFKICFAVDPDPDTLGRVFINWLIAQLSMCQTTRARGSRKVEDTSGFEHFVAFLRQAFCSYSESLEFMDRVCESLQQFVQRCLIPQTQKLNDEPRFGREIEQNERALLQDFSTIAAQMESKLLGRRVEVFYVSAEDTLADFARKRLRFAAHKGNVHPFFEEVNRELRVSALAFLESGSVYYFRLDSQGRLVRNAPVQPDLPILTLSSVPSGRQKKITASWGCDCSQVYLGREDRELHRLPLYNLNALRDGEEATLSGQICQRLQALLVPEKASSDIIIEILRLLERLKLPQKELAFLRQDLNAVPPTYHDLFKNVRVLYERICAQNREALLFKSLLTADGVKVEITERWKKWRALLILVVNSLTFFLVLGLSFDKRMFEVRSGDAFFYGEENAKWLRRFCLMMGGGTIAYLLRGALGFLPEFFAENFLKRALQKLSTDILDALVSSMATCNTDPARIATASRALIPAGSDRAVDFPQVLREFCEAMEILGRYAEGQLPPEVLECFSRSGELRKRQAGSSPVTAELSRSVIQKLLTLQVLVTALSSATVAVGGAVISTQVINPNKDLSPLTLVTIYVALAGTLLTAHLWLVSTGKAAAQLVRSTRGKVGFFAAVPAHAATVNTQQDAHAVAMPNTQGDTPEAPLLRGLARDLRRNPGRGCPWPSCSVM